MYPEIKPEQNLDRKSTYWDRTPEDPQAWEHCRIKRLPGTLCGLLCYSEESQDYCVVVLKKIEIPNWCTIISPVYEKGNQMWKVISEVRFYNVTHTSDKISNAIW